MVKIHKTSKEIHRLLLKFVRPSTSLSKVIRMSSGTIYLDYLSKLACYGLDTEVKTLTLWINLLGTQTEGAAQR